MGEIHDAVEAGDLEEVRRLLDGGASADERGDYIGTPLHVAALKSNHDIAALLLDRGADVNARDDMGRTPLHWPAVQPNAGAGVNARDGSGATALGQAASRNQAETADLLRARDGVE